MEGLKIYIYIYIDISLVLYCKNLERTFILHAKNPYGFYLFISGNPTVEHQWRTSAPVAQRRTSDPTHQRTSGAKTVQPHPRRLNVAANGAWTSLRMTLPVVSEGCCKWRLQKRLQWHCNYALNMPENGASKGASNGVGMVAEAHLERRQNNAWTAPEARLQMAPEACLKRHLKLRLNNA